MGPLLERLAGTRGGTVNQTMRIDHCKARNERCYLLLCAKGFIFCKFVDVSGRINGRVIFRDCFQNNFRKSLQSNAVFIYSSKLKRQCCCKRGR